MAKKYYAVKKGLVPGIYTEWDTCKKMINGYPNAEYKGFQTIEEANEYLHSDKIKKEGNKSDVNLSGNYAFVDGSFNSETGRYGYGGFLVHDGMKDNLQGSGIDKELASMRNVSGEIFGCMAAVKRAVELHLTELTIYYDYVGIEMWATGKWKRNKRGTITYYEFMQNAQKYIKINFKKVKGHSGIKGNEEADKLAKEAVGIK